MTLYRHKNTVLNAEDKFSRNRNHSSTPSYLASTATPNNLNQLGKIGIQLLSKKNLEAGQVHAFFWSMVESYADRFHKYPFDINKALFSYLELTDFPEDEIKKLVKQLEVQFESSHGRPLRQSAQSLGSGVLDDEIKSLRDSLKYAAMVAEVD